MATAVRPLMRVTRPPPATRPGRPPTSRAQRRRPRAPAPPGSASTSASGVGDAEADPQRGRAPPRAERPIASSVLLGSTAPEEQAEPVETAKPARSRRMSSASPSTPGKRDVRGVAAAAATPAQWTTAPGIAAQPALEAVAQRRRGARAAPRSSAPRRRRRRAEADDRRHVLGRGPAAPLLAAAHAGAPASSTPLAHPERRGAQRAVELVGAERQVVDARAPRRRPRSCPPPAPRRRAPARRARGRPRRPRPPAAGCRARCWRASGRPAGCPAAARRRPPPPATTPSRPGRHPRHRASPLGSSRAAASRIDGCSSAEITRWPRPPRASRHAAKTTALLASVPEAVKTISAGRRRAAPPPAPAPPRPPRAPPARSAWIEDGLPCARRARAAWPRAPADRAAWWRCCRGRPGSRACDSSASRGIDPQIFVVK